MPLIYSENNVQEFGVENNWHNASVKDSVITRRGTKVEMIVRPKWGLACYMDNSIQSALIDERIYHESLVHPIMSSAKKRDRVLIIGGGEGATAREVLKWDDVKHVDMYEWDEDVVTLFKNKYPQWAKGAWSDHRLNIVFSNIFIAILEKPLSDNKYDVIIVDLFEPNVGVQWCSLVKSLSNWLTNDGSVVMYAGMRNILEVRQPFESLKDIIEFNEMSSGHLVRDLSNNLNTIIPYHVWIPSFSGESVFLLCCPNDTYKPNFKELEEKESHITRCVWESYKTFNW